MPSFGHENQNSRYGAITRALPPTTGKIFFVTHADNTETAFMPYEFPVDRDGVPRVYTTTSGAATDDVAIQAAIDACVDGRNDYVIIMPGGNNDYDLTATINMNKDDVHLVSFEGLEAKRSYGASRQVVIDQTGDYDVITMNAHNVEIAGLYIKPKQNYDCITGGTNTNHSPHIHRNTFYVYGTGKGLDFPSSACIYGVFERNLFTSVTGTSPHAVYVGASSTGAVIRKNVVMCGDGATFTLGIRNDAYKGITEYNTVVATDGTGASGTVTTAFTVTGGVCNHNTANTANTADFTTTGTNAQAGNYTNTDHIT